MYGNIPYELQHETVMVDIKEWEEIKQQNLRILHSRMPSLGIHTIPEEMNCAHKRSKNCLSKRKKQK